MKLTKKQFDNLKAARRDGCANSNYLKDTYEVTYDQVRAFVRVLDVLGGLDGNTLTLAEVNAALAGKRVCLCYLQPEEIAAVEEAFAKPK
jgi:hypothetical protein